MNLVIGVAGEDDAAGIAALRSAAADDLTARYGRGHWSAHTDAAAVERGMQSSIVLRAVREGTIVGTLRLSRARPWAIESRYFTPSERPLYLLDMAVDPAVQRQGVGRALLRAAAETARREDADAIRLDAYDSTAGAGGFYRRCGYTDVGHVVYRGVPLIYFECLL